MHCEILLRFLLIAGGLLFWTVGGPFQARCRGRSRGGFLPFAGSKPIVVNAENCLVAQSPLLISRRGVKPDSIEG